MFNNGYATEPKACRRDPEEDLKRLRDEKFCISNLIISLKRFAESGIYIEGHESSEQGFRLLGQLVVKDWEYDKRIDQLLNEINSK